MTEDQIVEEMKQEVLEITKARMLDEKTTGKKPHIYDVSKEIINTLEGLMKDDN